MYKQIKAFKIDHLQNVVMFMIESWSLLSITNTNLWPNSEKNSALLTFWNRYEISLMVMKLE